MGRLLAEMQKAVPAYLTRIGIALSQGSLTRETLVPANMEYYETLCGPKPRTSVVDDYLTGELTSFRRTLIQTDPVAGLQMCLAMALRDDISGVGLWNGTGEELWDALGRIDYRSDPFSILGVLDLALDRIADPRFAELADRFIRHLCQPTLDRGDGVDIYAFYPALIDMVDSAVAFVPGMRDQPVFWRRLCSWSQAAAISRALQPMTLEMASFANWCAEQTPDYAKLAALLDIRQTPASLPGTMSAQKIKSEVLGRLLILRARYTDKGWPSAATPVLDQAVDELVTSGHANSHLLSGPLDGDRRPQRPLSSLPEADRQIYPSVIAGLAAGLGDPSWQQLGHLSRFYRLETEARQNAVAALQGAKTDRCPDREHAFAVLANVGFMALAQDWPDLSDAVLAVACARAI